METAGVLVLSCGVWVLYCATNGIPVLSTVSAIIANPSGAADIIGKARTASDQENTKLNAGAVATSASTAIGGGGSFGTSGAANPFSGDGISDGFGARGGEHKGVDYVMPVGTPLPAAISGVVTTTTSGGTGGYIATITAKNGYSVDYMHLSKFAPGINGKSVSIGTIIGYSGGAAGAVGAGDSTGAHLHFQVNTPGGTPIDPAKYFGVKD